VNNKKSDDPLADLDPPNDDDNPVAGKAWDEDIERQAAEIKAKAAALASKQDKRKQERQHRKPAPNVSDVADVSPAPETDSGALLLADVEIFVGRFVIYPPEHAKVAHVLWIAHAHLMDVWDSTPRLAFLSPEPASGKTRALEVTELLVPSPVEAVNVSPAYLFRKVGEGASCTILFDEIDTVFGPKAKENEEIRGLLNAGHRQGAVAGRCVVRGNVVETEEISAYCAVALAGLGWLPDTLLSRSIIIRMRRRKPGEKVKPFRRRTELNAGYKLKARLRHWARRVRPGITWPVMPPGVEDRDADIWEALIAVARAAGGIWPDRASRAALALIKEARDREPSLGIRLLADLKTVFGGAQEMTTASILHALHVLPEAPWNDLKGKPLNDRGLAIRLRQYGIKPKVIRVGDATPRGYAVADGLYDAWETYLPPAQADTSATNATSATSGGNTSNFSAENVADSDEASATNATASETCQCTICKGPTGDPQAICTNQMGLPLGDGRGAQSGAADVADRAANVSDDVADRGAENASNNNNVSDVALVALPPEADRDDDDLRYLTISGKSELRSHHGALWRRGNDSLPPTGNGSPLDFQRSSL
jgi:hypothetical protein